MKRAASKGSARDAGSSRDYRRDLLLGVLLSLAVLTVYWQVTEHDFVNYDDDLYVTENYIVQQGVTRGSIAWSMTAVVSSNWHPVTLWSHMLDCQLFGLDPGRHHLTSLIIHVLNSLLLFHVLRRMTGAWWACWYVAALFALHPLHVESVAWISERKDVLSTSFWLATMWCYIRYVERPCAGRYLPVPVFFALGLMSKPMLVTLPFVLLLLDYWPLKRVGPGPTGWKRPVLEKLPLFAITAASCIVTYLVQQGSGAVYSTHTFPITGRFANAAVSYVAYLVQTIWPSGMALPYPQAESLPAWQVVGACLLLAGISAAAVIFRKQKPYLAVGWFWYLGTLVPVIGVVQVGIQARADRYTYIPLVGMFIIIAWGIPDVLRRWRLARPLTAIAALTTIAALSSITWIQAGYWKDSVTLYRHSLSVTTDNYTVHNNLGLALAATGNRSEAIEHYTEALRINPGYAKAHNNLGSALRREGRFAEAGEHLRAAIRLEPDNAKAYNNLGNCLTQQGRLAEAIEEYSKALSLDPEYALAHYNIGFALMRSGREEEAMQHYFETVRINPNHARAHNNLGVALRDAGRTAEAMHHFREALRIDPGYEKARKNLEQGAQTGIMSHE